MFGDIISLKIVNGSVELSISIWTILIVVVLLLGWLLWKKRLSGYFQSDVELQINLGGIGSVSIKPNYEVKQIAHQAWVELKTRKAGLPIDKDNDIISDIYKSWYLLFSEIRTLTKNIPASKLKNEDTCKLVELLIETLNNGLRPHLTRWRAKYERWYDKAVAKSDHDELTPQDIQNRYPQYKELVEDMVKINEQLVQYTGEIKKLLDG